MIRKKFDFPELRLCGKIFVNFRKITVRGTSCTVRHLAKFELLAQASNKTHRDSLQKFIPVNFEILTQSCIGTQNGI